MLVNVVCLKWGTKYDCDYVNRLYSMVERNLSVSHRFICLTDDPAELHPEIETRAIEHPELEGWWHKLTLFKRQFHDLEGPTLFLDLDIVIVDRLDPFFNQKGEFCIIGDWTPNYYYSAVFRLNIGSHPEVWETFKRGQDEITERFLGDQDWINETISNATPWPDGWVVSYKKHCIPLGGNGPAKIPSNARIVAFHGLPRQHEIKDGPSNGWKEATWINDHWK
ncbi:MAG TPA: hypothetical protein VIF64_17565 [Pyrinomonadaceae bacterium]|jgi:hypothetical protein